MYPRSGVHNRITQARLLRPGGSDKTDGILIKGQSLGDGGHPQLRRSQSPNLDRQPEPVEELGPKLALLRIHRADQHEARRFARGEAVSLHCDPTACRRIQQQVDEVMSQEIDLIDVQNAAVGPGKQPGTKLTPTVAKRRGDIQRSHDPVLGRTQGQLDERRDVSRSALGQQRGQATSHGTLRRPTLAPDEHSTDRRVNGNELQGQLQVFLADDSGEGILESHETPTLRAVEPSSAASLSNSKLRRAVERCAEGRHIPRCSASSSRSAIAFNAQGLLRSRNSRDSASVNAAAAPSYIQSVTIPTVAE